MDGSTDGRKRTIGDVGCGLAGLMRVLMARWTLDHDERASKHRPSVCLFLCVPVCLCRERF